MSLLNYSLAAIVTYLGLVAGMLLAFSTEEELKPGRKYFVILKHICFISIFAGLFYYFFVNKLMPELIITAILFIILGSLCYCSAVKLKKSKRKPIIISYIIYAVLAIVFYLSSRVIGMQIIISSLIFIYGLPAGTILTDPRKKAKSFWIVLSHVFYVAIAVILKLSFL
ncbi:hypothetical protein KY361_06120 [Candidatus Woesearchaeota archaeon]|nr:hypothetical protein [Candidatus Woesearchaeota archaeon]